MVKLSEVTDEHFEEVQQGPIPSDNDDDFEEYSDTDSETSSSHPHSHHQHPPQSSRKPSHPKPNRFASVADEEDEEESDSEDEDEDGLTLEESMYERLVALKDMIPIKQRTRMGNFVQGVWGWVSWGVRGGGNVAFVVSTGVLMLGVPYALAVAEEGQMMEMEREMKLQQQANELIQAPSGAGQQQQGGIQIR